MRESKPVCALEGRVRVRPKRYFCDPSLAAALLGATPGRLLGDMQTLGILFENLVLRDVRVFLSTYGGVDNSVHYFRDEKGLEVDLIVEHDGRWGAIEVKLSDAKTDDGARNLKALERKVLSNPAAQNAAPAFLAVVVGKGGHCLHTRRRRGGDPHGGTWGVVVLRACRASITENPFVRPGVRG